MQTATVDRRTDTPPHPDSLREAARTLAEIMSIEGLQQEQLKAIRDGKRDTEALYTLAIHLSESRGEQEGQEKELFITGDKLITDRLEVKRLVGKVLQRGTIGQIYGPSGSGKTFIIIGIVCSVATGTTWNGHQCEQGLVLYFVGEGYHGIKKRLRAWLKQHGYPPGIENLIISKSTVTLNPAGIRRIIAEVRKHETRTGRKVALIVIDTLARHILGDENSTKDMTEFINSVATVQDSFPDSTAILVHHTGHNSENSNRSRGSSALKAALDFEIQCDKGLLTFQKVKDEEIPPPIEFKLIPVEVGTDDDGDPITSCYVHYGERSAKNRDALLTAAEKELLELVTVTPGSFSGDLKTAFFEKRKEREPDVKFATVKKAFERALKGLIAKDRIFMDGFSVLPGQGQNRDITGTCPKEETGTNGTHLFRGVPVSRPSVPPHEPLDDLPMEVGA